MKRLLILPFSLLALSLFGQNNKRPVADAGRDTIFMTTQIPFTYELNGTNSNDEDGKLTHYYWVHDSDTISTEPILQVSLSEPLEEFRLIVVDDSLDTDDDVVKIFIGHPTNNHKNRIRLPHGPSVFASGMNIAWNRYANDLHGFEPSDEAFFIRVFDSIAYYGGNTVRWWLHTNGANTPQVNASGFVEGIDFEAIQTMKQVLDLAYDRGIMISMCLWSFDMLQQQNQDLQAMQQLLENEENIQSYIDNALIPILERIGDHPAIMTWEIFNEPEGMTSTFGWTNGGRVGMPEVQRFVNKCAGAIHRTVPGMLVSNGSWSFLASTDQGNGTHYYARERLIEVGGDQDGYLDFYQVHFYPQHFGNDLSPFHRPASFWGLDAPIVIGEMPADTLSGQIFPGYATAEAYELAIQYGYAGIMSWSWTDDDFNKDFATTARALNRVREVIPDALALPNDLEVNRVPQLETYVRPIRMLVEAFNEDTIQYDLALSFQDEEQGNDLAYSVVHVESPEDVAVTLVASSKLRYQINPVPGMSHLTYRATDAAGWYAEGATLAMVGSIEGHEDNLGYYKNVQATSVKDRDFDVYANDGDLQTFWTAQRKVNESLTIDLASLTTFNFLAIHWKNLAPSEYTLSVSDDQESWHLLEEVMDGSGRTSLHHFGSSISTRYVRVEGVNAGSQPEIGIREVLIEQVDSNEPPQILKEVEDLRQELAALRSLNNYVRFDELFTDTEHPDLLTYSFTNSNDAVVRPEISIGNVGLSLIFRDSEIGESEIEITATDPFGASTSVQFKVAVVDLLLSTASSAAGLRAFPNPTGHKFQLEIPSLFPETGEVWLSDLNGKHILNYPYHGRKLELDLSSQESGLYLLTIKANNQFLQIKIIKR